MINSPEMRRRANHLVNYLRNDSTLPKKIQELAMLVEHDYASTIVARDRVFCLKLIRTEMHAQMREDAALTEHFHNRMTERLKQTAKELRRIDNALAARSPATLSGLLVSSRTDRTPRSCRIDAARS